MEHDLMKTAEVARALRVHKTTVVKMIRAGALRAIKLPSGHWRIYRASFEAWLKNQASGPVDQ
jgi:excisionase family DNA binding protein